MPRRLGLALAILVLVVDQASKYAVLDALAGIRDIKVTGFFDLVLACNKGISFGILNSDEIDARWILVALTMGIAGAVTWWLWRAANRLQAAALGLVLGGAVGNIIDRILHGCVVDFLSFHAYGWYWPAFNAADSAIAVGVAGLLWDSLFHGRKTPK